MHIKARIARDAVNLLHKLCADEWGADVPKSGTVPIPEQPDILVTLVKPVALLAGTRMIFPMFSDLRSAKAFEPFASDRALEVVSLPVSEAVVGRPAVTFTLSGLGENARSAPFESIVIFFDPASLDDVLRPGTTRERLSIPLAEQPANLGASLFE